MYFNMLNNGEIYVMIYRTARNRKRTMRACYPDDKCTVRYRD